MTQAAGEGPATLLIQIDSAGLDEETVDRLTRQLAIELRETDVQSVELVSVAASEGAKSGGAIDIGTLAARVVPAAVPFLLAALREWVRRPQAPPVKVKGKFGEINFPHDEMTHEQLLELIAAMSQSD